MQQVHFYFHDRRPVLKDRKRLKGFIKDLFAKEKKKLGSINYVFCSDKHLHGINLGFLKHDFYTDIVTFDLSSNTEETEGEVYISVDRVKENANKLGAPFCEELHRVIFHGALHLCGYKDKKRADALKMRSKEDIYIKKYFN